VHAAFVEVDVVEEGLDVCAVGEPAFGEALLEAFGEVVVPTAFAHALVPDGHEFLVGFPTLLKTPGEERIVGLVWVRADLFGEGLVRNTEEANAAEVEASAEICDVVFRQASFGVETDFVDHPTEVDDTAGFVVWAAEAGDVHG
jgi:hypothetical protein